MKRYRIKPVHIYARRRLVEFIFVVLILSILTGFAEYIMPRYTKTAKLSESVNFVRDIQIHMVVDAAFTGHWPKKEYIPVDVSGRNAPTVTDYRVSQSGNIALFLSDEVGIGEAKVLGFNLYAQTHDSPFYFYRWRCGDTTLNTPWHVADPIKSNVSPTFSHTICRNRDDNK